MKGLRFISAPLALAALLFSLAGAALPARAASPSLIFSSAPQGIRVGDRITISIQAASADQAVNAVSGAVSYPESLLDVVSVSKEGSIVNLWTDDPHVASGGKVLFEGVILNPGYQGAAGRLFSVTFEGKRAGTATLSFSEGSLLANDGLGTNILGSLGSRTFSIGESLPYVAGVPEVEESGRLAALPVITEYSQSVESKDDIYVKGKGEPNALTKIAFKDVSVKSVGERLIGILQTKKKRLDEVLVKNDASGGFEYISPKNLAAGVYNATPFLVDSDTNTEKPGLGVQLLVSDSKVVKDLVIFINILGLLIPIVGLMVIIYFIPWYSFRRMRVLKKKLGLEEEKLDISGRQLEREDKKLDQPAAAPAQNPPRPPAPGL